MESDGRPRDAELVRALIICSLLRDRRRSERLAAILYVNGLSDLSGTVNRMVATLSSDVASAASRLAASSFGSRGIGVGSAPPTARGTVLDRNKVCLTLGGWLRKQLVARLVEEERDAEQEAVVRRGAAAALIRRLLEDALESEEMHASVLTAYVDLSARVREALVAEVRRQYTSLASAIQEL